MIERTDDVEIRLPGSEEEPVQQMTLKDYLDSIYREADARESVFSSRQAWLVEVGLRLLADRSEMEVYLVPDGSTILKFKAREAPPGQLKVGA